MAVHLKISANGRVCIPADVRARLGLKDGDTLCWRSRKTGSCFSQLNTAFAGRRIASERP
jgi:bifunctional DNA-binding transcriptional regulator/antitoxin component of YhaV-PrlF toxin-antitoxin module